MRSETETTERADPADVAAARTRRAAAILQSAIDLAVVATDLDGRVTDWNAGAEMLLGWTAGEMVGREIGTFFIPEDRDAGVPEREMRLAREEGRAEDERWHLKKDGSRFWASGVVTPLRVDGVHAGYVKVLGDLTDRIRQGADLLNAQARMASSEDRYRSLVEAIEDGFCVFEMKFDDFTGTAVDYRFVEVNAAFEAHTGLVDAVGKWMRTLAPAHEQSWFDRYGEVARTGRPMRFEDEAAALGRHYDIHAFRLGTAQKPLVGALFRDISARRMADLALRKSEELGRRQAAELARLNDDLERQVAERTADRNALWQLSADIMLRCRFDGVMVATNPAWLEVLGWEEKELLGTNLFDLLHPEDLEHTRQGAAASSEGARLNRFENRYRHRDGTYRWISWSTRPAEGLINAVGRDVTFEKEQAATLARTEEALRQSQKMEAVGQLTGGLAHEFNNLLAGISGSLELMATRMAQGRLTELDRYMGAAQGASKRAAALTHRLLAFSRRQTLDPRPTDVNRLVSGMEDLVRRTVGPGIGVEAVAASGLWPTLVDPPQLENALLNLCINARDAMPDGGRLTIETGNRQMDRRAAAEHDIAPGQYISLCVSDTGSGMTPDVVAKAFDPFFTTKPIGQGTGLGLSMIYGFARQSGGHVRIYSEPGQGSTICIYLPRLAGQADMQEPLPELADAPRAVDGETVLIVDDEPTVRMLVTEVLGELGYSAAEAADGPSGLRVLRSDVRIDLLVTDVGLPGGMNGRQMADAARETRPGLKVLFITGYAENAAVGNGNLAPGMEVLTKPFAMEALATRIKEMIASG